MAARLATLPAARQVGSVHAEKGLRRDGATSARTGSDLGQHEEEQRPIRRRLRRAAKLRRVGLLDRLLRRGGATETGTRARTPESEHSGEGDQRTPDSGSAENIVDPSRIPGEGEEPDRPPRSQ